MRLKRLAALPLALWGLASAGGMEPLTRLEALRGIPGVVRVFEVPQGRLGKEGYTHLVTIREAGAAVQVRVSLGATEGSGAVNTSLLWVDRPLVTVLDREVLTRLARGIAARCFVGVTAGQLDALRALAGRNWQAELGWQSTRVGPLHLEWSGREGLNVADREAPGLSLEWPANASRCVF
ncbi:hypothetical protein [Deinococcus aetherius]|uniref:hypothetical protein n=1 Tax=Deinococcus aetherius TaxID=200252 RepID=UPI002232469E|nr:hypothetical protein [Deinococcus aetherius]